MTEELVLVLELFTLCLKDWYWHWNWLYNVWRIGINWYWNWNCLNNDWRIGIGTGIVYTKAEKLVLVLELFTQCLKNWYCIVFCLALFFMGVGVLVLDNTWSYNNNNVCIFIHQTLMTMPNRDLYCLAPS